MCYIIFLIKMVDLFLRRSVCKQDFKGKEEKWIHLAKIIRHFLGNNDELYKKIPNC